MLPLNKVPYLGNTSGSEEIACLYFNTRIWQLDRSGRTGEVLKWMEFMGLLVSLEPATANLILKGGWLEWNKKIQLTALKPFSISLPERLLQELTAIFLSALVMNETLAPSYASFICWLSLGCLLCRMSAVHSLPSLFLPPFLSSVFPL